MTTEWKWRIYLFVRATDTTNANKNALAQIYVDGGAGETLENEKRMFNGVVRLSTTGAEPATVFGINLTAKQGMKDAFLTFFAGLSAQTVWAALTNTAYNDFADGEVLAVSDTLDPTFVGTTATWQNALTYLENQYGLQVIQPPEEGVTTKLTGSVRAVNFFGRPVTVATTTLGNAIYDGLLAAAARVTRGNT